MVYKEQSGISNFFESYGRAIIYILISIVYNIIGFGLVVGGFFLFDFTALLALIGGDFSVLLDPTAFFGNVASIIGFVLIILGFLFIMIGGFAAFIFTATRGPKFSKKVSFFGAFGGSLKILSGFIIFLVILIGLSIGSLYIPVPIVVIIINFFVYILGALTPFAMLFRIVDHITDKV